MTAVLDDRTEWRGVIHRYAAVFAVPAFVVLVIRADSATQKLACAVYGLGVCSMLIVSAVYHSPGIGPVAKRRLRRADHSTILLAIAGSYTGVGALALDGNAEQRMLWFVWVATAIAITVRLAWLKAPYAVTTVVSLVVGWSALIELPGLLDALDDTETGLVVGGGLLYTVGAVIYALKKPNPRPGVFGYHEVFHALVTMAAACHYVAVLRLL
ncbi:MAG: hemolysin III family protein [Acidimicrobiales bacterium]|nr:hemolysin III family protein [Acidimicrobiales bacterium]